MVALLVALFFTPYMAVAQGCWTIGCRTFSQSTSTAITLDGSNHCSASTPGTSPVASLSCTLPGVTAGDLITVEFSDRDGLITGISDPTNGSYTGLFYVADSSGPAWGGMAYFQTSASGSLAVTVTLTGASAGNDTLISAQAWRTPPGGGALDTGFSPYNQVQTGSVANANCGTAKTPSMPGELIVGYLVPDAATPTAGTNYTFIDQITAVGPVYPEYWIQTSAIATNAPYVSAADDWIAGCAAFKP
jgi:hypothetical protein